MVKSAAHLHFGTFGQFLCLSCAFISVTSAARRKSHPLEIEIDSGNIRGEIVDIHAKSYEVFKQIPYAAPPVGALRFQHDNDTYAVVVWIHGAEAHLPRKGGFQTGSADEYSQRHILLNFVSKNIVFVTLNYRLGVMGFLSKGDKVLPGNIGLWDIIMALKWVQKNIGAFKGDKTRVALMGHGTGASIASLLGLSPQTENLVHSLILMSGSAFSPGVVRTTAINATENLQKQLQCRGYNSTEILHCLTRRHKADLLSGNRTFFDDYEEWVPVVDGEYGVIPAHPEVLTARQRKLPLLIGTVSNESALHLPIFHGLDLHLLFGTKISDLNLADREDTHWQDDKFVKELFSTMIVNFAKTGNPTPPEANMAFNWTRFDPDQMNYLSITTVPQMKVGYHWRGQVFWNDYARYLDAVDVGNLRYIASLEKQLANFQLATWILLCCAIFFFAILIGLACYCTRKEPDEEEN